MKAYKCFQELKKYSINLKEVLKWRLVTYFHKHS
jgi:hypothetical protein